jgi:dTDP-4-dehydrorhamnose 3,5-epimerase
MYMEAEKKIRDLELDGVQVRDITKSTDERGYFAEVARNDWFELFDKNWLSQVNLSYSYPGIIRAWHRHARGQIDYFIVLHGAMKIVAYDDNKGSRTYGKIVEIVSSEERLQIVRIPGHYWHGTKTIGNKPSLTTYFVNNLYDYRNPDEERRAWNDSFIIDPRTKQTYDWSRPPHK